MTEEAERMLLRIPEGEDEEAIYFEEDEAGDKNVPKSLEQLLDEAQLDPSSVPKAMTLNDRIKEYVRTMHIPPITNWRELSDSEEGDEDGGGEGAEEEVKFTAELDFPQSEDTSPEKREDISDDDWDALLLKQKAAATSKSQEEVQHLCLLNVRSYGTYFHIPYEEMELRNEEQCHGCFQPGELGRCVCCGGSSAISPYCYLPKTHLKQRLVKESRVNHLLGMGRNFSEIDLHEWESSERLTADVCGTKTPQ